MCGLGPAPEISWACQLDRSVCPAIRDSRCPPPSTPGALCLARGFSQTSECSFLTALQTAQPGWGCPTAEQKGQIWFSCVKKATLENDTSGGCPLCVSYGQRDPFLVHVVLSSACMDGTDHATLGGNAGPGPQLLPQRNEIVFSAAPKLTASLRGAWQTLLSLLTTQTWRRGTKSQIIACRTKGSWGCRLWSPCLISGSSAGITCPEPEGQYQ